MSWVSSTGGDVSGGMGKLPTQFPGGVRGLGWV